MNEDDFCKIFGGVVGDCYQWNKFAEEYKRDAARWICYLDGNNLTLLVTYLDGYLKAERP